MSKKPPKIVIVDSCQETIDNISKILEKNNYEIMGKLNSPVETIKMAQLNSIDIFIIGLLLDDITGFKLIEILIESNDSNYIIVSPTNHESIRVEFIKSKANDIIHKPITENILMQSIKRIEHKFIIKEAI